MKSTNPTNVEMRRLMTMAFDAPVIRQLAFDDARAARRTSTRRGTTDQPRRRGESTRPSSRRIGAD
jgi:hypothetical protein